jgi:drug/metabolite transporter (DMT)-like permease
VTLSLAVTLLVLLAALFHAGWNALVKMEPDRFLAIALIHGAAGVMGAVLVLVAPPMDAAAWWYLGPSIVTQQVYSLILVQAYRIGDLSQVYPLARGTAPVAVVLLSLWLLGDPLPWNKVLGVAAVSLGVVSLAWHRDFLSHGRWKPVVLSLINGVIIGGYTILDGRGVRAGGSPMAYGGWLFLWFGLPWLAALPFYPPARKRRWERHWALLLLAGGGLCCAAYLLVVWALSLQAAAPVSALRETSVIFAALLGSLLLREPFGLRRIAASAVVAAGVVLISL